MVLVRGPMPRLSHPLDQFAIAFNWAAWMRAPVADGGEHERPERAVRRRKALAEVVQVRDEDVSALL